LCGGDGEERACGSPAERGNETIEQHQTQDVFSLRPECQPDGLRAIRKLSLWISTGKRASILRCARSQLLDAGRLHRTNVSSKLVLSPVSGLPTIV
jgi:hypothetical protein